MFLFADIAKTYRVAVGAIPAQWIDDIKVVHDADEVLAEVTAILKDVYAWGILGLDLEWVCADSPNPLDALGAGAPRAIITWVGIGCGTRAVSFKWEALGAMPSGLEALQAAMADESLPKLCHNKQADKAVWEAQVGSIGGRILDTMLMHHCAFPGIDHDLQQVASQFLCVPPWKVEHAHAIAAAKERERMQIKEVKQVERAQKKTANALAHVERNQKLKEEGEARKAQRKAAHEARNAALKAEKEARRAEKLGPRVDPRQLKLVLEG
jgi:hypothetical protein